MRTVLRISLTSAALLGLAACAGGSGGGSGPTPPPPLTDPTGAVFSYRPAGDLAPGSGTGFTDDTVYLPGMRFPLEAAPAYPNSQVYAAGGSNPPPGSSGGQCALSNYSYPWRDNYCETRTWTMPLCAEGTGHQGQDIRPATCQKSVHWTVAAENGQITAIGSYSVTLLGASGTIHRYLHMDMGHLAVTLGQTVTRGQRIGLVSNDFAGTPTTIHLHYDMRQAITLSTGEAITAYVPPYTSLVEGYERLLRGAP